MKITANIICLNEIDYLQSALESIYNVVDKIVIVEGCSKSYTQFANSKGLSVDGTTELILSFPDPEKKISYYPVGFCEKVNDLRDMALQKTDKDTDYILVVDGDTLFDETEINNVKKIAMKYPNIRAFWGNHLMFFGDMKHILTVGESFKQGCGYYIPIFFWKYTPQLRYAHQMVYVEGHSDGCYWRDVPEITLKELEAGKYKDEEVVLTDIIFNIYHYGWVRMKDRLDVHIYQRVKGYIKSAENKKKNKELIDKQSDMLYALRDASYKEVIEWIESYHKIYTGVFDTRCNEHLEEYLLSQPEAIKKHPWWGLEKSDFGL